MKGYKGFDKDLKCRDFQFEVGKEYQIDGELEICNRGFHFCQKLINVYDFYSFGDSRICEIEALGNVITEESKSVTNHIEIIRELTKFEVLHLVNIGTGNTGYGNSGDGNSGDRNSGDGNSGDRNSGDRNSGYRNSGNFCACNNSAGLFMSKRISFEAFNKSLAENQFINLISSKGFAICKKFHLVKYRIRAKTGKYGDYEYMSYKKSWAIFWNNLSFAERIEIRKMPYLDEKVFEEITGIKMSGVYGRND